MSRMTLPNILTFVRIALVPVVVALFYFDRPISNWIVAGIFVFACITDYLDGYFARTLKQDSPFGTFLDPVADKLLISATLLMLVGFRRIEGIALIPAVIILCREILVSGLREFLSETHVSIPVSQLAKWKTGLQMVALTFLIIEDVSFFPLAFLGTLFLWLAAFLTLVTGVDYLRAGVRYIES